MRRARVERKGGKSWLARGGRGTPEAMSLEIIQRWFSQPTVVKIVTAVVAVVVIRLLASIVLRGLVRRIKDNTGRYHARKLVLFSSYLVAGLAITVVFSARLGSLTVAFGVAGAGIAFALQEVIASVAGWVAVLFGNFYRIGDRVELGGIRGDVIDIGVLRTTLMETGEWVKGDLYNGRIVRVANSFVFKAPVYNYTADFPFLWDELKLPVKYGSDHREARALLERIAKENLSEYAAGAEATWKGLVGRYAIEDARVEPMVTLVATDNWIELTLRYAVDVKRRRTTQDELFMAILDAVEATEGRVQLASATFEIVAAPSLEVRLADRAA